MVTLREPIPQLAVNPEEIKPTRFTSQPAGFLQNFPLFSA
jgi:hypothetical protein